MPQFLFEGIYRNLSKIIVAMEFNQVNTVQATVRSLLSPHNFMLHAKAFNNKVQQIS